MRSTQEKFIGRMQALADERELDLVIDHSFTNIGTISFQREDLFHPVMTFGFNFQSGYASFTGDDLREETSNPWTYVLPAKRQGRSDATLDELVVHIIERLGQKLGEK